MRNPATGITEMVEQSRISIAPGIEKINKSYLSLFNGTLIQVKYFQMSTNVIQYT